MKFHVAKSGNETIVTVYRASDIEHQEKMTIVFKFFRYKYVLMKLA